MTRALALLAFAGCATLRAAPDHDAVTPRAVATIARIYAANGLPAPPIASVRWEVGFYVEGSDRAGVTEWNGATCDIRVATAPIPVPGPWLRAEREPESFIGGTALAHEVLHCCLFARDGNGDPKHTGGEWQLVWWANQALAMEKL
jgi:hypothetical protein